MNAADFSSSRRGRRFQVQLVFLTMLAAALTAGTVIYAGCATGPGAELEGPVSRAVDRMVAEAKKRKPPLPESEWNPVGLWVRTRSTPATYLPRGWSRKATREGVDGHWYVDQRDGKRLFVPQSGSGGLSEGTLRGEAIKVTLWSTGSYLPGVQEFPVERGERRTEE